MWRACERAKEQFISSYRFSSRHGFSVVTDFIRLCVLVRASGGEPHGATHKHKRYSKYKWCSLFHSLQYCDTIWITMNAIFDFPFYETSKARASLDGNAALGGESFCRTYSIFDSANFHNFSFIYILHFVPMQINHMRLTVNLFEWKLFTLLLPESNSKSKIFNTRVCVLFMLREMYYTLYMDDATIHVHCSL